MDLFCNKANITGYAKIAFDALNSTVTEETNNAYSKGVEAFGYDPLKNEGAVSLTIIF